MHGLGISNDEALRIGSLARANGVTRSSNPYICSDARLAEQWDAGWLAHARVREEFSGGSDGDTNVRGPLHADPNCREYRNGRLAHANGIDRTQNPCAAMDYELAHQWNAGWEAHSSFRNIAVLGDQLSWPFEAFHSRCSGSGVRLRSSLFYWSGLVAFISGIVLLGKDVMAGGFLVLTLAPCLLLYPLIRFLFGGNGGVVPAITTVVVEEVLKHNAIERLSGKARRE